MEYHYPKFTPEMKKTHTILIPNMAVTQFRLMEYALRCEGYKCELLGNCGSAVAQLGLKYVHNDTCYPALLVIGQFLDALNSGKYDLEHTALLITQTGGGCRASNYIHLLRKALVKAGYPQIPVASLNFSGLEKDSGFQMTLPLARKCIACIFYGDMLCALRNQVAPYENEKGAADRMVDRWIARLGRALLAGKGFTSREMKHTFPLIAKEFATIPVTRAQGQGGCCGRDLRQVQPAGQQRLAEVSGSQDCEVNFPGLMGFVQYCAFNMGEDHVLYGGKLAVKVGTDQFLNWLDSVERVMLKAETDAGFYAPGPFKELVKKPKGVISLGAKMGEGWLLTAEMIELVQGGYGNIVCAQPFGCLPNHIVGKGMVNKIRALYPSANITPIDYDQCYPGQSGKPHQADAGGGQGAAERPRRSPAAYGRAARRRRPSGWRYRVTKANTIKQGSRCTAFLRSSSLFAGKEPLWKSPQLPVIICPACSSFTSCTAAFCRCTGSTGNIFTIGAP